MALKRNNGTNDIEQGKFFRDNGTNDVQIGKMFRSDGTVDSQIYTSEEILYNRGDLCTDITGGWSTSKYSADGWHTSNITLSKAAESLNATLSKDDDNMCGSFFTTNKVDLTGYSKLCAEVTVTASSTSRKPFYFGAYSAKPTSSSRGESVKRISSSTVTNGILEIDINEIEGPHYVVLQTFKLSGWGSTAQSSKTYKVWLE